MPEPIPRSRRSRSSRRRPRRIALDALAPELIAEIVEASHVYARLVRQRTRRPFPGLPRSNPTASARFAGFARVVAAAHVDHVPVSELLYAAFDRIRDWHGVPYPPLNALTGDRLRATHREWLAERTANQSLGHDRDDAPLDDYRLLLKQAAMSQRRWNRWRAQGRSLDAFVVAFAATLSPWWLVLQPWWADFRERALAGMPPAQAQETRQAEMQAQHYAHDIWRACAVRETRS